MWINLCEIDLLGLKVREKLFSQSFSMNEQPQSPQYKTFKLLLVFVFVFYFPSFLRANYLIIEPQEILYEFDDTYKFTPEKAQQESKLPKFSMSFTWSRNDQERVLHLPSSDADIRRLFNLYRMLKKNLGDRDVTADSPDSDGVRVTIIGEDNQELDSALIVGSALRSARGFSFINILEAKDKKVTLNHQSSTANTPLTAGE